MSPPPGTVSPSANRSSGLLTKLWVKELINAHEPGSPHSVSPREETPAVRAPAPTPPSLARRGALIPLPSAPSRGATSPDSYQTFSPLARDPGLRGLSACPFSWFHLEPLPGLGASSPPPAALPLSPAFLGRGSPRSEEFPRVTSATLAFLSRLYLDIISKRSCPQDDHAGRSCAQDDAARPRAKLPAQRVSSGR